MKYVPPSVRKAAFNCPYCDAFAHQTWYSVGAKALWGQEKADLLPSIIVQDLEQHSLHLSLHQDASPRSQLENVSVASCFSCDKVSVWIYGGLMYPRTAGGVPLANPDLSDKIRRDYDEASSILDESPRGAAALMRLAIQELCIEVGQPGKNLNDDIATLVKVGLDPLVQQALDTVRVIGNNAVHPGVMDLDDDRATAESLFGLLNLIAERMISDPKHVKEVYSRLPDKERKSIETRDGKK